MKQFLMVLFVLLPTFIVHSVELPWSTVKQLKGTFIQEKHIKALSRPFITKGQYSYTEKAGLIWHTLKPIDNILHINKKGIAELQTDGSVKMITNDANFSQLLLPIFNADSDKLQEQFQISTTPSGLSLYPLNSTIQSVIEHINLKVTQQNLQQIDLHEPNGNSTVIYLTSEPQSMAAQ